MDTWAIALREYHLSNPGEKFSIPKRGTDKYNAISALRKNMTARTPEDYVYGGERISHNKSVKLKHDENKTPKRKYTKKSAMVRQEEDS